MSAGDERRAIDRLVAGLPVDADELATAITSSAMQRTVVVNAVLRGLESDEPTVRLRAATRVGRMPDLAPRLAGPLRMVALEDADPRVREAAAEALRTHDSSAAAEPPVAARAPAIAVVALRLLTSRAPESDLVLHAEYRADAPHLLVRVDMEGPWNARLSVRGLPEAFFGMHPELHVLREPDARELTPVGRAETPVTRAGETSMRLTAAGSLEELERWFRDGAELVVPSD